MGKRLRAGDLVEVKQVEEIMATLDEAGRADGLPFMPEMLAFVGRRFRVSKRAHKTCDTVHQTGGRRLRNCVHLRELRCDGSGHDNCQASCLLFWKESWLRRIPDRKHQQDSSASTTQPPHDALDALLHSNTRSLGDQGAPTVYRCQATALFDATKPLPWWHAGQYMEDLTSGNVSIGRMFQVLFFHGLHKLVQTGVGYRLWRNVYDRLQPGFGGYRYPFRKGTVPKGGKTPVETLDLQPGERVRIKSHDEILDTLSTDKRNRGMRFDEEMVPYCEKEFAVVKRVDRIIHETTGKMIVIKSPSVILDGVVCRSELSDCRLFCPRAIPSYWREIWLERTEHEPSSD